MLSHAIRYSFIDVLGRNSLRMPFGQRRASNARLVSMGPDTDKARFVSVEVGVTTAEVTDAMARRLFSETDTEDLYRRLNEPRVERRARVAVF